MKKGVLVHLLVNSGEIQFSVDANWQLSRNNNKKKIKKIEQMMSKRPIKKKKDIYLKMMRSEGEGV